MTANNIDSKVMTLKEASAFVRCSKAHFCNIANGKVRGLPPMKKIRIGRRVLFFRESLEEWLRQVEEQGVTVADEDARASRLQRENDLASGEN